MVELFSFLVLLALIIFTFKILGALFKVGIFLLSIPLQIIVALFLSLILVAIFPAILLTGLISVIVIPLGILAPILPVLFIIYGIYLLTK